MAKKVTKVFSNMTNLELSQAIQEMKEDGPKGIIREDGVIRRKCKMVHDIVGGNTYEHLMMVHFSILQEAAYRFTPKDNKMGLNVDDTVECLTSDGWLTGKVLSFNEDKINVFVEELQSERLFESEFIRK